MGELGNIIDLNFKIIQNFHIYRNPTPKSSKWKSTKSFPLDYMRIGNDNGKVVESLTKMEKDLYPDRANFWAELKAHYPSIGEFSKKDEL